jgi:hypothetical protein
MPSRDLNRALCSSGGGAVGEDSAGSSSLVDTTNCLWEVWDRAGAPEIVRYEIVGRRLWAEADTAREAKYWHHNQDILMAN